MLSDEQRSDLEAASALLAGAQAAFDRALGAPGSWPDRYWWRVLDAARDLVAEAHTQMGEVLNEQAAFEVLRRHQTEKGAGEIDGQS